MSKSVKVNFILKFFVGTKIESMPNSLTGTGTLGWRSLGAGVTGVIVVAAIYWWFTRDSDSDPQAKKKNFPNKKKISTPEKAQDDEPKGKETSGSEDAAEEEFWAVEAVQIVKPQILKLDSHHNTENLATIGEVNSETQDSSPLRKFTGASQTELEGLSKSGQVNF